MSDPELDTLGTCIALLDALPHPSRVRVMRFLADRVLLHDVRERLTTQTLPPVDDVDDATESTSLRGRWPRCSSISPGGRRCRQIDGHDGEHRNRRGARTEVWP